MTQQPTALVTGAGGQDGTYLARALGAEGYRVVGTVSPYGEGSARLLTYAPRTETVALDIRDEEGLRALVARVRPQEIYNLAGVSSVARSWAEPELTFACNTGPVATLVEAALKLRADGVDARLFQASSAEALAGQSPYARSKAAAADLVAAARTEHGLFGAVGTLFNHESPLRTDRFVTHKIAAGAAAIAAGRAESITLGNLEVVRDWGFAGEYVDAMRALLRTPEPVDVQIGTGVAHTLRDLVETAFAAAGVDDPWAHVRQSADLLRPTDVEVQVADPAPALRHLGWRARTTFATVIDHMVAVELQRGRTGVIDAPGYLFPGSPV